MLVLPFSTLGPVEVVNISLLVLFTVCFVYQIAYIFISFFKKRSLPDASTNHKYAVLICARNEQNVISDLVHSIRQQNYPAELIDLYVIADNCTDDTAAVARKAGATVFERNNLQLIGKGYALQHGLANIEESCGIDSYAAFFVFDADNVLDQNYFREMNKAYDNGALACTSYRNAKNFGSNWISAGYGVWFLREAKYLNQARFALNTSCAISGTGFFVSSELIKRNGGWNYHLLTEDIEFTVDTILQNERIAYCANAVIYDEQPIRFRDSWNQRLRWARGFYQVFGHYGGKLFLGEFTSPKGHRFACYDLLMSIAPALLLMVSALGFNLAAMVLGLINSALVPASTMGIAAFSLVFPCAYYSIFMFALGLITTITEWRKIRSTTARKILAIFTFPFFMLTYIPIGITALFKKPKWKPTRHCISVDVEDFGHYLSSELERL